MWSSAKIANLEKEKSDGKHRGSVEVSADTLFSSFLLISCDFEVILM